MCPIKVTLLCILPKADKLISGFAAFIYTSTFYYSKVSGITLLASFSKKIQILGPICRPVTKRIKQTLKT